MVIRCFSCTRQFEARRGSDDLCPDCADRELAESQRPTRSFVGYLRAGRGVLLGGVKYHSSPRYEREADARTWAESSMECNRLARRHVAESGVMPSEQAPEIMAADLA